MSVGLGVVNFGRVADNPHMAELPPLGEVPTLVRGPYPPPSPPAYPPAYPPACPAPTGSLFKRLHEPQRRTRHGRGGGCHLRSGACFCRRRGRRGRRGGRSIRCRRRLSPGGCRCGRFCPLGSLYCRLGRGGVKGIGAGCRRWVFRGCGCSRVVGVGVVGVEWVGVGWDWCSVGLV